MQQNKLTKLKLHEFWTSVKKPKQEIINGQVKVREKILTEPQHSVRSVKTRTLHQLWTLTGHDMSDFLCRRKHPADVQSRSGTMCQTCLFPFEELMPFWAAAPPISPINELRSTHGYNYVEDCGDDTHDVCLTDSPLVWLLAPRWRAWWDTWSFQDIYRNLFHPASSCYLSSIS